MSKKTHFENAGSRTTSEEAQYKTVKCEQCAKSFASQEALEHHIDDVHRDVRSSERKRNSRKNRQRRMKKGVRANQQAGKRTKISLRAVRYGKGPAGKRM